MKNKTWDRIAWGALLLASFALGLLIMTGCGGGAEDEAELDTGEVQTELTGVPNNYGWLSSGKQRCVHNPKNYVTNICLLPKFGGGGNVVVNYTWANDAGTPFERNAFTDAMHHFAMNNHGGNIITLQGPADMATGYNIKIRLISPGNVNPGIPFEMGAVVTCPIPFGCTNGNRYQYGKVSIDVSLFELRKLIALTPGGYESQMIWHVVNRALSNGMGLGNVPTPSSTVRLMNPSDSFSFMSILITNDEDIMLRQYTP